MYRLALLVAVLVSLVGCYTVPSYAYGDLFVTAPYTSDENYSLEVGACRGETLIIRWNVGEGKNPKLIASPAQNIEPPLPSRLEKSGEVQVTFKDSVTISFTIEADQNFEAERQVVAIPELDGKAISPSRQSQVLEIQVLGEVTLTLVSPKGGGEEIIKMIPNEVCRGFPVNLIADFEGTLQQTLPEPASLPRAIEMRWRDATLEASLSGATC